MYLPPSAKLNESFQIIDTIEHRYGTTPFFNALVRMAEDRSHLYARRKRIKNPIIKDKNGDES